MFSRRSTLEVGLDRLRLTLFLFALLLVSATAQAQTITYGETLAGTLSVAGEVDSYTFAATAGDVVLVRLSETTSSLEPRLRLFRPGSVVVEDTWAYTTAELEGITLGFTGSYTIWVSDNGSDETGDYALHLQRLDAPENATATGYDDAQAGSLVLDAETVAYQFDAMAGDRIFAATTRTTSTFTPTMRLYDPGGTRLVLQSGSPTALINAYEIPSTGAYTLLVLDNAGTSQGEYRLKLQCVNDPVGASTLHFGDTVIGNWAHAADFATYRFAANAGDRLLARLSENVSGVEPQMHLYDADGDQLEGTWAYTTALFDATTLDASTTYTLIVHDNAFDELGDFTLHIQNTLTPANVTALTWGTEVGDHLADRAQTIVYSFPAIAGDCIFLRMTREVTTFTPYFGVYDAAGEPVVSSSGSPTAGIDAWVAPSTGTYWVFAQDNAGTGTGSYQLHAQCTNDPGLATVVTYGETLATSITQMAQTKAFRFVASAGDRLYIRLAEAVSGVEPDLRLYDPDGDKLASVWAYTTAEMTALEMPATGTYTILAMDQSGDEVGDLSLHLQRTFAPAGGMALVWGATVAESLDFRAETVPYTFDAVAGDRVMLRMGRDVSTFTPNLMVFDPNGEFVASSSGSPLAEFDAVEIVTAGTHTVLCEDNAGTGVGAFHLHAQKLNDPGMATTVSFGETVSGTIGEKATARFHRFSGNAGDRVLVRMSEGTAGLEPELRLYDANGQRLQATWAYTTALFDAYELPSTGLYTVLAGDQSADETGEYWFHLQRTSDPAGIVDLAYGGVQPDEVLYRAQSKAYRIAANAGDRVLLQMTRAASTMTPLIVLYAPDGTRVDDWSGSPTARGNSVLLSAAGNYSVFALDNSGTGSGPYVMHVQRLNDPGDARTISYNQSLSGTLDSIAQTRAFTFTAGSGDSVTIELEEITSTLEPELRLYDPSGVQLASTWAYTKAVLGQRLGGAGTYTILASENSCDELGDFELTLNGHATAVPDPGVLYTALRLHPAYPNPFNPTTVLAFDLPRAQHVVLDVLSLDGRRVARLIDRTLGAGRHEPVWHGRDDAGRSVASGTYLYELRVGADRRVNKMVLLR